MADFVRASIFVLFIVGLFTAASAVPVRNGMSWNIEADSSVNGLASMHPAAGPAEEESDGEVPLTADRENCTHFRRDGMDCEKCDSVNAATGQTHSRTNCASHTYSSHSSSFSSSSSADSDSDNSNF
ncbi:hypothetical protein BV898_08346 [Hypsibius exemplaris]|uniref:Uncharacterized protein n=1 Tax=Hypsibius exemplaris TaxID=2072580 RepID=A0A1W0WQU5_HYPEX|nr:hypothetical protein BV898_08346 [Hypsibius exemplaris]